MARKPSPSPQAQLAGMVRDAINEGLDARLDRTPTAAEIRGALEKAAADNPDHPFIDLETAVTEYADALAYMAARDEADGHELGAAVWTNLRPTEAARLNELVNKAHHNALERAEAVIIEELTAAGVAFAAEHPSAPLSGAFVETQRAKVAAA